MLDSKWPHCDCFFWNLGKCQHTVIGSDSDYKLSRWQQDECEIHKVFNHNVGCASFCFFLYQGCASEPPFNLSVYPKCLTCVVYIFLAGKLV